VVVLSEQSSDDFAGGIVGVGDEVERLVDADDGEQRDHLVEQGAPITIGPHQPFVDARGQWYGEGAVGGFDEQAHGL